MRHHQLVFLSKLPVELPSGLEKDVKKVYWHQVRQWLSQREEAVTDEVGRFLLSSFAAFLTEGGISMETVNGDFRMLKYALPQLRNLVDVMREAKKEVKEELKERFNFGDIAIGQ